MPAPQRDRESPPATIHKVKDVSCTAHKSSVIKERTKSSLAPSDAFPLSWKCSPAGQFSMHVSILKPALYIVFSFTYLYGFIYITIIIM